MKLHISPALVLAGCLLSIGNAYAHAHLKGQEPAADAVVSTSPTALSLGFTEGLEIRLSGVTLKGPDSQTIQTGAPVLGADDDKQMNVPLNGPLAVGKYTVEWRALSKDGHTSHGSYQFTVNP